MISPLKNCEEEQKSDSTSEKVPRPYGINDNEALLLNEKAKIRKRSTNKLSLFNKNTGKATSILNVI